MNKIVLFRLKLPKPRETEVTWEMGLIIAGAVILAIYTVGFLVMEIL